MASTFSIWYSTPPPLARPATGRPFKSAMVRTSPLSQRSLRAVNALYFTPASECALSATALSAMPRATAL